MDTIETVKVKREGPKGYHIINKSSFDPAVHELYEESTEPVNDADAEEIEESTEPVKRGRKPKGE